MRSLLYKRVLMFDQHSIPPPGALVVTLFPEISAFLICTLAASSRFANRIPPPPTDWSSQPSAELFLIFTGFSSVPLITNPGVVVVCLIVMKEFITFQVCFWAKWPRFAVCYHRQTDFTRACLPIFSLWVSIRHPRLDSEGVYCTPLTLNLLQEFLIPGYSPRCFFGRGSEGVSEKTENRSLLPSQPGRWDRGRFQLHPKSRVNM